MANVLDKIVRHKRDEIAQAKSRLSQAELSRRVADAPPVRSFAAALLATPGVALIAEVKKASPSAGLIREDFGPVTIARAYESHGAACLSVLTDEHFFQGRLEYLVEIRRQAGVPVLRKDFILDEYQIVEARAAGADAVLLIAECLPGDELRKLYDQIGDHGMQALVELYDEANLERVLALQPRIIGVNNRDLRTFVTDIHRAMRLREQAPKEVAFVAESGIRTRADVELLAAAKVDAMLVGESLMREADPGAAVDRLLGK